ncbi:MAG: hypothetical protein QOD51_2864, partial [Candidatus Eremiobacteraeota bacterium]|nr:hypothetical protein [Candidatus Eremiobacteraeota bacterium]
KQPFALTGSVVLAAVLVLTFATNERTVADYEAERAAQLNVAAAFDDGIADGVPQEAELWADAPAQIFRRADEMRLGNGGLADARFFVAEHGRRTLRVRATWQQPPPMECAAASCAVPSAVYAVRDVPLGIRDGYTVLGHVRRVAIGSDHLARPFVDDLRLHVRGAGLANLAASAARPGLALRLACTGRPALRTVAVDVAPADVARGIVLRLPAPCLVDLEYVSLVRRPGAS